jgi:hypothetical protein
MRLGDLDSLKEKLSDKNYITYTHEYGDAIPVEWVMNAIDNAPAVEPYCYFCGQKEHGIRPQGEWIYGEDDCGQDGWFCSECNFFVPWYYQYYEKDIDFIRDYKACPYCLAEMVTYTGKDRDTKGGEEE